MGNDGGSIPTRRELVKEAARNPSAIELKESQHSQQEFCWTTDPISNKPLAQPVVSDSSGKLYNKDTVIEFLVDGTYKEDAENVTQGTIKSLKDVVEVKFDIESESSAESNGVSNRQLWKCPITGDRLGPGSKAVYIVPCGHAFSASASKEVSGEKCLTCETEYASNDIISILPTAAEDIARLSLRIKTLQEKGLTHSLKKASGSGKKRKKQDLSVDEPVAATNGAKSSQIKTGTPRTSTPVNGTEAKATATINNSSTASLTARVMEEQERSKKRKLENENVKSLFSSGDQKANLGKSNDFMSRGYSLPAGGKR